jgi:hypothetical protein
MESFLKQPAQSYEFLDATFLQAMNDIGRYGHDKYGKDSFHHRAQNGDHSRGDMDRTTSYAIASHARGHFDMYLANEKHDHFNTRKHQLAAVAFNAMMEFFFDGEEMSDAAGVKQ